MGSEMIVVIMAGGFGTRFQTMTRQMALENEKLFGEKCVDIPKPMAVIGGIPVLEREINCLKDQGYKEILITASYLSKVIEDYFGDGSGVSRATGKPFDCHISYFIEKQPLGNAGALWKCYDYLSDDFLLLNADSLFNIDFGRFVKFHYEHKALVTLFTHPNAHPYDSGLIITGTNHVVQSWLNKEDRRPEWYANRVNAGIHVINKKALDVAVDLSNIDIDHIGEKDINGEIIKVDLDRQLLKPICQTKKVYSYDSPEYVKDMGTPDRFHQVCADFHNGIIEKKNLIHRQRAIFLDRDGTINKYVGFLTDIKDFELIDSITDGIIRINKSGYLCIVITNQPVVARGEVTIDELDIIHKRMETELGNKGAYIDAIYYCPHHPDKGFVGEIPELKVDCTCRKPKPGMIFRAAEDFNIDLSSSWIFGDGQNDILCGINAGVHTALYVGEGSDSLHMPKNGVNPDLICRSLTELCNYLGLQ